MPRIKLSEIHKQRIALALIGNKNPLGNKHSEETKNKIRQKRLERKLRLGYINSPEVRIKMSQRMKGKEAWNKGKTGYMSKEGRDRIRQARLNTPPEKHYNWKGGKSFEPYPIVFTNRYKIAIKQRDNYTCGLCGIKEQDYFQKLSVHHIDYDKHNCNKKNLITLCRSCNAKVNTNREKWTQFFKDKVQRL